MANQPDATLLAQLQDKVAQLATNPNDTALRTSIISGQVDMTAKQLGVSKAQAGDVVRTFTAAYATSKGLDPQSTLDVLSAEEQRLLQYSKAEPKLYGLDLVTANQLAGYLGIGSGILLTFALTAFTIALFTVGPEAAAAISAGEGVVATIGLALGNKFIATGGFLFLLSQFLGHLSSGIPMMTKQMIDNGSIGPGLRITALKQATDLEAKLQGSTNPGPFSAPAFESYAAGLENAGIAAINDPAKNATVIYSRKNLADIITYVYGQAIVQGDSLTTTKIIPKIRPYLVIPGSTAPAAVSTPAAVSASSASSSAGGSSTTAPAVKVFTGLLTSGTLGSQPAFVPRESGLIESAAELTQDAQQEAASFLAALPASIVYEVRIVNYVVAPDGTRRNGTVQRIRTGTLKNGTPKYRVLRNKFAVLDLYYNDAAPGRTKLAELIIGPVDVAAFNPTPSDLAALTGSMQGSVVTSNIGAIQSIVSAQPINTIAPATTTPAAAPSSSALSAAGVRYDPAWEAYGITLAGWNNLAPASRDAVIPRDGQTGKIISSTPVVAPAPVATAPASTPVATAPVASTPSLDFSKTRIASGYVYNLPDGAGNYFSGQLTDAPAIPMGKLYEAKGLGPASTYTGNATQIARLDQLI